MTLGVERPHLWWFDDPPKITSPRGGRGKRPAKGRAPSRSLAGRLQGPGPTRKNAPRPPKSPGMQSRPPVFDRSRTQAPRRLAIPALVKSPRRALLSSRTLRSAESSNSG
jgi:hypothetical protein